MAQRKQPSPSKSLGPAILYFQPTAFKWIEAAELAEWEKTMALRVGIVPARDEASPSQGRTTRMRNRSGKSYFKCGGAEWDGCDVS